MTSDRAREQSTYSSHILRIGWTSRITNHALRLPRDAFCFLLRRSLAKARLERSWLPGTVPRTTRGKIGFWSSQGLSPSETSRIPQKSAPKVAPSRPLQNQQGEEIAIEPQIDGKSTIDQTSRTGLPRSRGRFELPRRRRGAR